MRRIEEQPLTEQLVILVDDLHRLHPLECDIVAALSWLPLNLPQVGEFLFYLSTHCLYILFDHV